MLKQGSPQEWSAEKTNSGRNKTDEFWLCHCFISLCRKGKVSLRLKHRADLQGTTEWTEEYHVCPTRRPSGPRGRSGSSKVIKCLLFQITPSCIRLPERLFSAFRKKEEEWVFLFEWKRNKEEESKQQVVGERGMIGCLLFKPQYPESKTRSLVSELENWDVAAHSPVRWHASGR